MYWHRKPWLHGAATYHVSGPSLLATAMADVLVTEGIASSESQQCLLLKYFHCLCLHHVDVQVRTLQMVVV